MILPIRTNISPRRTPYLNYTLIAINVCVFLLTYWPHDTVLGGQIVREPLREWANIFVLHPDMPKIWQFISYAFLHGSILHIAGNMYFLYLFGNIVNDKLGDVGYLAFYLAGAVFSGLGHSIAFDASSVLGASGAVAAVTGAYLVLFPQTLITVLYWFFFIGTFELPALYFIAFKLIFWDNILMADPAAGIAYNAHLAGYAFGVLAPLGLLATGIIKHSHFDLWSMLRQWNRRRQYRDAVSNGYSPFSGGTGRKRVSVREVKNPAQRQREEEIVHMRNQIASLIRQHNIQAAADIYINLLKKDPNQVLAREYQLDVANQLMSTGNWEISAQAYEKFLISFPNYGYIEQIQLMLGILYSRYLHRADLAINYLKEAQKKLTDPGQLKMCKDELQKLEN